MDEHAIQLNLLDWLANFVEQPNKKLNNWPPCPYAKQSRLANKIKIVFDSPMNIAKYTSNIEEYDAIILCFDHTKYSSSQIELFSKHINSILVWQDFVVLEDHPDTEEHVNQVKMNFGQCGLLVLQKLSKLNAAADKLKDKGYYQTWSKESLDEVVNWRYDICKN